MLDALAGAKHIEVLDGLGHIPFRRAKPDPWRRVVGRLVDSLGP